MSLQDIFDPVVRACFKNKCTGGGSGGGTAQDTGVMAVAWHSEGSYEQPMGEGMFKVSDITPSIEQFNNARAFINIEGLSCATYKATVENAEGMIGLLIPSGGGATSVGVVVPADSGMPPEMVGFYICPPVDGLTDCYIVWEP